MLLHFKYLLIVYYLYDTLLHCAGKTSYYMVLQRPAITYLNRSYISYANFTSRRHGRGSPMYYVDTHFTSLVPIDNTFKMHYYFYEFLSNEYRRGFVEMHISACDFIKKDPFFSPGLRQGKFLQPCPYPPGNYHFYNASVPSAVIPPGFPITKGRIYGNFTHYGHDVFCAYIDMELKEKLIRPGRP